MKSIEWDYIIKDDGFIKLMKYIGNDDVVKIPSTIDDGKVTEIGANVFNNRVIRKLYIPESIEYIEKYFFKYANVSEEIAVAEGNLIYSSISGIVYNKDKLVLLYCPKSRSHVEVPKTVMLIEDYAFYKCEMLESINLSEYIEKLGEFAFYKNTKLREIKLPEEVEVISDGCFSGCSSLEEITIPERVYEIGNHAFEQCVSLKSITLPQILPQIRDHTFYGCQILDEISLPLNLNSIGEAAFYDCHNIKEIIIPPSCYAISSNAFYFCANAVVYYPCNSNYYIDRSAKVTCSKDKFMKLFPNEELAKKEKKDDARWLNKNPNPRVQIGYNMGLTYVAITKVYNPNNVTQPFDKIELFGKRIFISLEEIERNNEKLKNRARLTDENQAFDVCEGCNECIMSDADYIDESDYH